MGDLADLMLMARAFRVSLGEEAVGDPPTRRIWERESHAQVEWMDEQTRAGVYPQGPFTRPCPEMTAPPPFSREEKYDPRNRGVR